MNVCKRESICNRTGGQGSLQSLQKIGAYAMVNTTPPGGLFGFAMPGGCERNTPADFNSFSLR